MKDKHIGALYILLAASAYACMGALVKWGGKTLSDEQLVFMRNFICLVLLLPFIFFPERKPLGTSVFGIHVFRSVAGLLNMYCFFYSIRYILLSDAMLLNNTMPLFIPLVMWVWKRKKIQLPLVPGLGIGFIGVMLILHPGRGIFQLAALLALASGLFMAVSMAGIRHLTHSEPIYRILFYYFALSTLFSAVPLIWAWTSLSLEMALVLIGVGIFAAIYQYFLTKGYSKASASKVSPFIYFAVVLSGLFDWIFWNQRPDLLSLAGLLLVFIGAYICIRSE